MSVSAFDQFLVSVAGKSRDLLFDGRAYGHRNGARNLASNRPDGSPRSNKNNRRRVPLPKASSALAVRVNHPRALLHRLQLQLDPSSVAIQFTAGLATDSKVRLFFDGLLSPITRKKKGTVDHRVFWRLPSPLPVLSLHHVDDTDRNQSPTLHNGALAVSEQVDRIRWRHRNLKSPTSQRRMSTSRPRRHSSQDGEQDTHSQPVSMVAAQVNADLSFELMERKANTNTAFPVTTNAMAEPSWITDDEWTPTSDGKTLTTEGDPAAELAALRAENAEQKALIRQLLVENRRLLAQQSQPQYQLKNRQHKKRQRTATGRVAMTYEPEDRNTNKLVFDIGADTLVDPMFDHLVSEIHLELAELLSEDDTVCSSYYSGLSTRSNSTSDHHSLAAAA